MGFRFQRRVRILPGVSLNLSKSGVSCSVGPRGAKLTVGPKGIRKTVGIPGTGLSYSSFDGFGKGAKTPPDDSARLEAGFFRRLFLSSAERRFIDGVKALLREDMVGAYGHLSGADSLADAAFTAGFIALNQGEWLEARASFAACEPVAGDLGKLYAKYGLGLVLSLPICEYVQIEVRPEWVSLQLGAVEALQRSGEFGAACQILIGLCRREPGNAAVKLSLAELIFECAPEDRAWLETVAKLTAAGSGDRRIDRALKFYRAAALENLGMAEAALELLNRALVDVEEADDALTLALRFRRGVILADGGRAAEARRDFELVYLEDPDYPGLAGRLRG